MSRKNEPTCKKQQDEETFVFRCVRQREGARRKRRFSNIKSTGFAELSIETEKTAERAKGISFGGLMAAVHSQKMLSLCSIPPR